MLVYWESMVWSIIANGVVHIKYKTLYKTKLMVLKCRVFPASPSVSIMIICDQRVYGAADGG